MQTASNPKCILLRQFAKISTFHYYQAVILFLHWQKGGFACADIYFCSWNKKAKVVLKNSSVKNGYGGVNIHEKSTKNLSQTHASRESLTFFFSTGWLSVGFRVSDWNNLLLHQIKCNLSKQRPARSCISFQCLWMPLFISHWFYRVTILIETHI